jgi:ABC-2 type transport system ATP-binding protein
MSGRPGAEPPAIAAVGLSKRYGTIAALTDLTMTVAPGTIYGFLGPNGAGKTTTIRLLMGFIKPSAGSAAIWGHDSHRDGVAARRDIGYLVVPGALYPDMTGRALLDYTAELSERAPTVRGLLLDALELGAEALDRRLGTYSRGMRQKLALVAACQHDPSLLILDEPTDGLDPLIQRNFESYLRERRDRGRTIFMSSHDLAEVERICERVAIVRGGRLVAEESVAGLQHLQRRIATVTFAGEVPFGLETIPGVAVRNRAGLRVELMVDQDVNPLLRFLADHPVADFLLTAPRLEDIFMAFYGDEAVGRLPSAPPAETHPEAAHR